MVVRRVRVQVCGFVVGAVCFIHSGDVWFLGAGAHGLRLGCGRAARELQSGGRGCVAAWCWVRKPALGCSAFALVS